MIYTAIGICVILTAHYFFKALLDPQLTICWVLKALRVPLAPGLES